MYNTAFKFSSELTFNTANTHLAALTTFVKQSKSNLLFIDLSNVTQCDSAGLALLIEIKRLCKRMKKSLTIANIPATVLALAEFCGVDSLLITPSSGF